MKEKKLDRRKNPYVALIKFPFRKDREVKRFPSEEAREKFISSIEDDIYSVIYLRTKEIVIYQGEILEDKERYQFYDPSRNWSDLEMDIYL